MCVCMHRVVHTKKVEIFGKCTLVTLEEYMQTYMHTCMNVWM